MAARGPASLTERLPESTAGQQGLTPERQSPVFTLSMQRLPAPQCRAAVGTAHGRHVVREASSVEKPRLLHGIQLPCISD